MGIGYRYGFKLYVSSKKALHSYMRKNGQDKNMILYLFIIDSHFCLSILLDCFPFIVKSNRLWIQVIYIAYFRVFFHDLERKLTLITCIVLNLLGLSGLSY